MVTVHPRLRQDWLRFYLAGRGGSKRWAKVAIEKGWNKGTNYRYDDERLENHDGNYGVVCKDGLVVCDFDSAAYHQALKRKLPKTFVVTTARSRLPHYYYRVEYEDEEKRLRKVGIDILGKRVCDVQAGGAGVIGPGSRYGRRKYKVKHDRKIATVSLKTLKDIFQIKEEDIKKKKWKGKGNTLDNFKRNVSLAVLYLCRVSVYTNRNMKCPFHPMKGHGNLSILPSGKIYCFHCFLCLWPDQFVAKFFKMKAWEAKKVVEQVAILYKERMDKKEKSGR